MVSFECDYIAGAHPEILRRLEETNMESLPGYGMDHYTESAKEKIKAACGVPDAEVEFLVGGTQTNSVVISTMLRDWEGVIAATSGHVSVHESGAIEFTGHKVIELPAKDGKLEADTVRKYLETFHSDVTHDHMVFPGMVYISYPTEYGTLYTKDELKELHQVCEKHKIPLYIDGARLAYGLASNACGMTLNEFAHLCDVFYIGGTKCGALCGEAVVFTKKNRPEHFMNAIKKRGALLAKGRLLGVQFETLFAGAEHGGFDDTLYYQIGSHGIGMADKLEKILRDKGCEFFLETPTNQKFVIMEDGKLENLRKKIDYGFWEKPDKEHTVIRLATSWSTAEKDLEAIKTAL